MADTSVCKTVDSAISQIYEIVYKIELLLHSRLSFVVFIPCKTQKCHYVIQ